MNSNFENNIKNAIQKTISHYARITLSNYINTDTIISNVNEAIQNSNYNFENAISFILNKNGKKRLIKKFSDIYSPENILCQVIKHILDRTYKIKYPNRNDTTKTIFNILPAIIQMMDFTIVKFDFKDYFNSVSSIYVFEKYLKFSIVDRFELNLIKNFVYSTKYAYAGFCTSNAIAEIIARYFDIAVKQMFFSNGIVFYERYIDDGILILNEHMDETEIKEKLKTIISNVFHDEKIKEAKCLTDFNNAKFKYISRIKIFKEKGIHSIDFLGYEFYFQNCNDKIINIQYGITKEKRDKYNKRIKKIISLYKKAESPDYKNIELLRHRVAAFCSREVYVTKYFNSYIWRVKGFISNYGNLCNFLETNLIEKETDKYLRNMINDAFKEEKIEPYFLKAGNSINCGYNLYFNMKRNKTILLVNNIGYSYKSLVKLCKKIGICAVDKNGKRRSYGALVKEYLIKIRVGY